MRAAILTGIATLALAASTVVALAQDQNVITVAVEGLVNDQGSVRCGLFNSADGWPNPGRQLMGVVAQISGGRSKCVFSNVPPGTYAVALFHAQHKETTLPTGLFGKPEEGFGFSRDASATFGPPSFQAAAYAYPGGNSVWPVHMQH
jgi:uncharacterized protein (DUF2141 family)